MTEQQARRIRLMVVFAIAALITLCNIDLVLNPFLAYWLKRWSVAARGATISVISVSAMSYMLWFWLRVDRLMLEYRSQGLTAEKLAASPHWWDQQKAWVIRRHEELTHPSNYWVRQIKRFGYPVVAVIGIIPELPGARTTVISFCGLTWWPRGFTVLLLADVVKNFGWTWFVNWVLHH